MSEYLKLELGAITTVTINRPESLNALCFDLLQEFNEKLDLIAASNQTNFLLIRSSSPKAFVAGADIREMLNSAPEHREKFITLGQSLMRKIENLNAVSIACVEGFALGGGCELALACDLIFASDRARFGQPEVNLGLIPGFGGTQRLLQRCGIGYARYLVFSGETISAEIAERKGLVDCIFASDKFEESLQAQLSVLSSRGPTAIKSAKKLIRQYAYDLLDRGLIAEQAEFLKIIEGAEAKEGMSAFVEKRKPAF